MKILILIRCNTEKMRRKIDENRRWIFFFHFDMQNTEQVTLGKRLLGECFENIKSFGKSKKTLMILDKGNEELPKSERFLVNSNGSFSICTSKRKFRIFVKVKVWKKC